MGLITKLIGTAATVVGATAAAKHIAEKISDKKADKMAKESKDIKIVKVNSIVEGLHNANYMEAQKTLIANGFKNLELVAKKDLKKQGTAKEGKVISISFNGQTEFNWLSKFPTNVKVVITYHTFIYANDADEVRCIESMVEKSFSKCQCCGANFEYDIKKPKCPYCGAAVGETN